MKKVICLIVLTALLATVCLVGLSGCDKAQTAGGSSIIPTGSDNSNNGLITSRYDNSDYNKDEVNNSVSNFGTETSSTESADVSSGATSSGLNIGENIFNDNHN